MTRADFDAEGIVLDAPDEGPAFQSATAVSHDDAADDMTHEPTIAGDMAILTRLAARAAPDATLLVVAKDPAAPLGARLTWIGASGSSDVGRSGSPLDVESDANVAAARGRRRVDGGAWTAARGRRRVDGGAGTAARGRRRVDGGAWTDAGPTPSLTFWSVSSARRLLR